MKHGLSEKHKFLYYILQVQHKHNILDFDIPLNPLSAAVKI